MNAPVVPLKNIGTLSEQAAPPLSGNVNRLPFQVNRLFRCATFFDKECSMQILNEDEIVQVGGGIGPIAGAFAGAGIAVGGAILGGILGAVARWVTSSLLPRRA